MAIFNVKRGFLIYYDTIIAGGIECICKEIYIIKNDYDIL